MGTLRDGKASRHKAEDALMASGVLAGVGNERAAVSRIVRRQWSPSETGSTTDGQASRARSGSSTRVGAKTQALREAMLGSGSSRFRRSLPSMSSRQTSEVDRLTPMCKNRSLPNPKRK